MYIFIAWTELLQYAMHVWGCDVKFYVTVLEKLLELVAIRSPVNNSLKISTLVFQEPFTCMYEERFNFLSCL